MFPNDLDFPAIKEMPAAAILTVATWNLEWATRGTDRGLRCAEVLADALADIIVATEAFRDLLPADGYTIDAGPDWGYPLKSGRRKVIIWSRFPLKCEAVGEAGGALGRLVVATAATPGGPVRVVGVCIPWRDAHVATGRADAQPWSEHLDHLDRLSELLAALNREVPTVIAGDFNQRIPRLRQPLRVAQKLAQTLAGWTVHTAGSLPNGPHIDHIATNDKLQCSSVNDWAAFDRLGRLSDHAGVVCRLSLVRGDEDRGAMPEAGRTSEPDGPNSDFLDEEPPSGGDETAAVFPAQLGSEVQLTPELRAEIEEILRGSPDGLEHGAAFRLREQGLTDKQIAAARNVKVSSTRVWLRSLEHLLGGTLPTDKTPVLNNSYGYRELLNHPRSIALDRYVMAQLRKLKDLNPAVSYEPLNTRVVPHSKPTRKKQCDNRIQKICPVCGTMHPGEC